MSAQWTPAVAPAPLEQMRHRQSLLIVLRPSTRAARRLERWAGCRRLVYNLVIGQWEARRPIRDRHRPMSFAGLCREITELRAAYPFLAAVPVHVLQQAALDALEATHKFYQGLADAPTFKRKATDALRMRFPDPATFSVDPRRRMVRLPKIGWIPARFPKAIGPDDRITSLTVRRDGGHWVVQAATESPLCAPLPTTGLALGLDVGVAQPITASDGTVYHIRDLTADETAHRARIQQRIARCRRGSRRQRRLRSRLNRLSTQVANRRRHDQHIATTEIVRRADHIVIEDLHVASMTSSAKGTVEAPGTNVRQKAGLNRVILGVGFGEIRRQLTYKAQWRGRRLTVVPAPGTSQTCADCGHRAAANRETQASFRCQQCGHTANADHNAAQVILQRGLVAAAASDLAAPGAPVRITKARRRQSHFRRRDRHANPGGEPAGVSATARTECT